MVTVTEKEGTKEKLRQLILGGDTIHSNETFINQQFHEQVNVSASRGLIIYNLQPSDAGKFLCRFKNTNTTASLENSLFLTVSILKLKNA